MTSSNLRVYFWGCWWIKKRNCVLQMWELPSSSHLQNIWMGGGGGCEWVEEKFGKCPWKETEEKRRRNAADHQTAESSSGWGWRLLGSLCWCCVFIRRPCLLLRCVQVTLTTVTVIWRQYSDSQYVKYGRLMQRSELWLFVKCWILSLLQATERDQTLKCLMSKTREKTCLV